MDTCSIESYGQRRLGRTQRTLHESWTVVESDTPGCKCAFGATRMPAWRARIGVRPVTEATIESPWSPSTRRAAPASFHAMSVPGPERFWADSYVGNSSIEGYGQRRLGHDTDTSGIGDCGGEDTPGCKCAFGATRIPAGLARRLRTSVRGRRDDAIEPPSTPSTRRAAPGSFQAVPGPGPWRFSDDSYV